MRLVLGRRSLPYWMLLATGAGACGDASPSQAPSSDSASAPVVDAAVVVAIDAGTITETRDASGPLVAMRAPSDASLAVVSEGSTPDAQSVDAPVESSAPSCIPEAGTDLPDENFTDTNCDGIDGDKSQSIFVAGTLGSDTGDGSFANPVKTFAEAIPLAVSSGKVLLVCNGTYAEGISLPKTGVSIYGGYDCENGWKRIEDAFVLAPPAGVALRIQNASGTTTINHASLQVADASSLGSSSIAAIVANSMAMFDHVILQAGAGAAGSDGPPATPNAQPAPSGPNGLGYGYLACTLSSCNEVAQGGGAYHPPPAFPGGSSGIGGDGVNHYVSVAPGVATSGGPPGQGGGTSSQDGLPGIPGVAGPDGLPAGSAIGTISATDYLPTNVGTDGQIGSPGGGGGGGAGGQWGNFGNPDIPCIPVVDVGGGGGGGGCGGAGGSAGSGGGGGGASIALLSFDSTVTLTSVTLTTSTGGSGGRASPGAAGQPGGQGGQGGEGEESGGCPLDPNPMAGAAGFPGGVGGAGGKGGAGGPGGGGPSIGIFSAGPIPTTDSNTIFNVSAGGHGATSPDFGMPGADGLSANTYAIDPSDAGSVAGGNF